MEGKKRKCQVQLNNLDNYLHMEIFYQLKRLVVQVWHNNHLNLTTLHSMYSKALYKDDRNIIPTNIPDNTAAYLGETHLEKLTGDGGHVVIKIQPEGNQYYIYLLSANDESMTVKYIFGPYKCK